MRVVLGTQEVHNLQDLPRDRTLLSLARIQVTTALFVFQGWESDLGALGLLHI